MQPAKTGVGDSPIAVDSRRDASARTRWRDLAARPLHYAAHMSHGDFKTITSDLASVRGGCCVSVSVNGQQVFGGQGGNAAAMGPPGDAQGASPTVAAQPSSGQGINPAAIGQQIGGLVDQFAPKLTGGKGAALGGQIGGLVSSFMGGGA